MPYSSGRSRRIVPGPPQLPHFQHHQRQHAPLAATRAGPAPRIRRADLEDVLPDPLSISDRPQHLIEQLANGVAGARQAPTNTMSQSSTGRSSGHSCTGL